MNAPLGRIRDQQSAPMAQLQTTNQTLPLIDLIRFAGSSEFESLRPASRSRSTAPLEEVRQVLDPLRRGAAGYNHREASPAIPDSNVPEPRVAAIESATALPSCHFHRGPA